MKLISRLSFLRSLALAPFAAKALVARGVVSQSQVPNKTLASCALRFPGDARPFSGFPKVRRFYNDVELDGTAGAVQIDWDVVPDEPTQSLYQAPDWFLRLTPVHSVYADRCLISMNTRDCTGRAPLRLPGTGLSLGFKRASVTVYREGFRYASERTVRDFSVHWHMRPSTPQELRTQHCQFISIPRVTTRWQELPT